MKRIFFIIIILSIGYGAYWGYKRVFYKDLGDKNKLVVDNNSTVSIYIQDDIPENLREIITDVVDKNGWEMSEDNPDVTFGASYKSEDYQSIYQFYVVTKPWNQLAEDDSATFSEVSDNIEIDSFNKINQSYFTYDEDSKSGYMLQTLSELDGTRLAVNTGKTSVFSNSWWDEKNYPLTLEVKVWGNKMVEEIINKLKDNKDFASYGFTTEYPNSSDFVEIAKTGTTVAGGPGWQLCENSYGSISYPIGEVKDFLSDADLSIISNESSFVEGCSQDAGTTAFCGKPEYLQNLLDAGIDIISLTGNHMNDYGRDYFTETLDLYAKNNVQYFAAGKNKEEAWQPLIIETEAGSIAFIGINKMGPDGVIATEELTGTAYYDYDLFLETLEGVKGKVDIIWLDTHLWPEYGTTPTQEQIAITQLAIDHGVDLVTGVSSHEPLGMTFYKDKPVFYGLGNFLFDQMWSDETRLSMVLKAYLFNSKIINIEVHPTRMYNYCQPRFLEGNDKTSILEYFVGISKL